VRTIEKESNGLWDEGVKEVKARKDEGKGDKGQRRLNV
jgi:hypothetical protein